MDECGVVLQNLHIVQVSQLVLRGFVNIEWRNPGHCVSKGLGLLAHLEGQSTIGYVEIVQIQFVPSPDVPE